MKYSSLIESQRNFTAMGQIAGNERRRWHGTPRECTLGDGANVKLCISPTCSLCGIIRSSFDMAFFGRKTGWEGTYFFCGLLGLPRTYSKYPEGLVVGYTPHRRLQSTSLVIILLEKNQLTFIRSDDYSQK